MAELVLIVEDNEKNMRLARDVLRFHGFEVLEATSAARGLELAIAHRPCLVLMDIHLPDMDGATALTALRDDPSMTDVPVVAMTAFAMREDRDRLLAAGFNGYMSKPIDVREFPKEVRRYCETGGRMSA
jgi:two-component system cell cycle response regulator DivK